MTLVSEQEYIDTEYEPECEYEDGVLIERNVGEKPHSRIQTLIAMYLALREDLWGVEAFMGQRHRVRKGKYMVPDICIVRAPSPDEDIFTRPH